MKFGRGFLRVFSDITIENIAENEKLTEGLSLIHLLIRFLTQKAMYS